MPHADGTVRKRAAGGDGGTASNITKGEQGYQKETSQFASLRLGMVAVARVWLIAVSVVVPAIPIFYDDRFRAFRSSGLGSFVTVRDPRVLVSGPTGRDVGVHRWWRRSSDMRFSLRWGPLLSIPVFCASDYSIFIPFGASGGASACCEPSQRPRLLTKGAECFGTETRHLSQVIRDTSKSNTSNGMYSTACTRDAVSCICFRGVWRAYPLETRVLKIDPFLGILSAVTLRTRRSEAPSQPCSATGWDTRR